MSTQLSENTVKVKLSDLRRHCRDLLEQPQPPVQAFRPPPHGDRPNAAPREPRT
jgi:hypothetical protein